jgi:hypothetical protein
MITLLFWLVVAGVAVYVVNAVIPMAQPFKIVFNAIVGLLLVAWFLTKLGLLHGTHLPF